MLHTGPCGSTWGNSGYGSPGPRWKAKTAEYRPVQLAGGGHTPRCDDFYTCLGAYDVREITKVQITEAMLSSARSSCTTRSCFRTLCVRTSAYRT
jgi:hypothetical protein